MKTISRGFLLALMGALISLAFLSIDLYLPSLHAIGVHFGAPAEKVQLTLTCFFIILSLIQLIYGPLSDRFGRRPMMLVSLSLFITGSLICAWAPSIEVLIAGRCIQALGTGSAILVFAMIRDLYQGPQVARIAAYMMSLASISPILAPMIGGYIQSILPWQCNFVLLLGISGTLFILSFFFLPETKEATQHEKSVVHEVFLNYLKLMGDKQFMQQALGAAFAFGALFVFLSASHRLFLTLMNVPPQQFGLIYAVVAFGYTLGAFLTGKFIPRLGMKKIFALGYAALILGSLAMVGLNQLYPLNIVAIVVPQFFCEAGIAMIIPITMTRALMPIPAYAGTGSALIGFMRFVFATVASLMTMDINSSAALGVITLVFALGSLCFANFRHKELGG